MKNYVNLHTHGVFSFLDGHGQYEAYAKRAKELGMPALAITEHGNLHGWLDFYDACKKHGIKPILGLEAYQARKTRFDRDEEERSGPSANEWDQRGPYHLTVLAKNETGYHNLIKLSSRAYLEGFYVKPRIDHELLAEYAEGLIVLSGCLSGEIQQALLRNDAEHAVKTAYKMQQIVGKENYFIEIHNHGIEAESRIHKALIALATEMDIPLVPTGDCHYTNKADADAHDTMLCVSTAARKDQENRFRFEQDEFYLKSYDEMLEDFEPEWLANSLLIGEMVELNPKFGELYFPEYPDVPEELSPYEYLEKLVDEKLSDRYEVITDEVKSRVIYELSVIRDMGFTEYFLVVWDLVNWARSQNIRVGWGRGSAAASIISYILGITNLDPLEFGLMFERFLVPGRKSMPDIDLDFDDRYRDRVVEYARQKYGSNRVVHIATFASVGARSALRDATRVLGGDYALADKLAKLVPPPVLGVSKSLEDSLRLSKDLADLYEKDAEVRKIIDAAKGLEGIYRQPGIHAAGIIIAKTDVTDYVPVMKKGDNAPVVTQWDMERTEQCGLLKIDFLALRNLAIIDLCVANIKSRTGQELDVDSIPQDDELTYAKLKQGENIGIFQIESGGMADMTMDLQPTNLYDIMALISLYRPGPMGSGMDKMYINRKHGREKLIDIHPAVAEALKKSQGIMLYQEDVLAVARILAGFDPGEADDLRKAVGKKQMDKIGLFRDKFVEGCKRTHGVQASKANKLYSDIEYFGGYGFNLAHAASYGILAYVTAYLKTHYPTEYMAALLTSVAEKKDRLAIYLNECRRLGIGVQAPSINKSDSEFSIDDNGDILFGLHAIDGVGPAVIQCLIKDRAKYLTFDGYYDFFRSCSSELLNKSVLEHLARAGALDDLLDEPDYTFLRQNKLEILDLEKAELGIYVTDHPLMEVWDLFGSKVHTTVNQIKEKSGARTTVLGGIITKLERKISKAHKTFYTFMFEDLTGSIEVIVFPREAAKLTEGLLIEGSMGTLEATVVKEGDEDNPRTKLYFNKFDKVSTLFLTGEAPIMLQSHQKLSNLQLEKLSDIISSKKGYSKVYLQYPEGDHLITLTFKESADRSLEPALKNIVQLNNMMEF